MSKGKDPSYIFPFLMKDIEFIMFLLLCSRSKSTHSGAHFSLVDLDTTLSNSQIVVKKEKTSSSVPIIRGLVDLTVKTLVYKYRKNTSPTNLSLENLGVVDVLRKQGCKYKHHFSFHIFLLSSTNVFFVSGL